MELQITTLSENTATHGGYLAEWGLSILVEVDGLRILFDTGAGNAAIYNAQLLGVDLRTIDKIVLSHGHGDHTGGLREVLRRTGEVEVIAHPDIWASKYSRPSSGKERFSGLPFLREDLESRGALFHLTREPVRSTDGVFTTGEVPMVTDYEEIDKDLCVRQDGILRPDPLADDLALVIDTDFGLVVILGCAHRGIINTLKRAQELAGKELVYAAIGGTHLLHASGDRLGKTIAELQAMGLQRLGVSHCTGFQASAELGREFGDVFFVNNAGTQLTLP